MTSAQEMIAFAGTGYFAGVSFCSTLMLRYVLVHRRKLGRMSQRTVSVLFLGYSGIQIMFLVHAVPIVFRKLRDSGVDENALVLLPLFGFIGLALCFVLAHLGAGVQMRLDLED